MPLCRFRPLSQPLCLALTLWAAVWLAGSAPQAAEQSAVPALSIEVGIDRPGEAYEVVDIPSNNHKDCMALCEQADKCQSYSYFHPRGDLPGRCWLREDLPHGWTSSCCISGRKADSFNDRSVRVFRRITAEDFEPQDTAAAPDAGTGAGTDAAPANPDQIPGLDLCLAEGRNCGRPAAEAFCRQQGHGEALDFTVEREGRPTIALGDGGRCRGRFCHRIRSVTCAFEADDTDTEAAANTES